MKTVCFTEWVKCILDTSRDWESKEGDGEEGKGKSKEENVKRMNRKSRGC